MFQNRHFLRKTYEQRNVTTRSASIYEPWELLCDKNPTVVPRQINGFFHTEAFQECCQRVPFKRVIATCQQTEAVLYNTEWLTVVGEECVQNTSTGRQGTRHTTTIYSNNSWLPSIAGDILRASFPGQSFYIMHFSLTLLLLMDYRSPAWHFPHIVPQIQHFSEKMS